jgi:hypothetical protein
VGAELFDADGQTDMMKLTVAFRNSANAANKKDVPEDKRKGEKNGEKAIVGGTTKLIVNEAV